VRNLAHTRHTRRTPPTEMKVNCPGIQCAERVIQPLASSSSLIWGAATCTEPHSFLLRPQLACTARRRDSVRRTTSSHTLSLTQAVTLPQQTLSLDLCAREQRSRPQACARTDHTACVAHGGCKLPVARHPPQNRKGRRHCRAIAAGKPFRRRCVRHPCAPPTPALCAAAPSATAHRRQHMV